MAKVTNFRLSDEDRVILDALSSDWRMSGRAVISELLRKADPRDGVHVEPEVKSETFTYEGDVKDFVKVTAKDVLPAEPKHVTGGMKRVQEIPVPDWMAKQSKLPGHTLTGKPHGSVPKGKK